MLPRLAALVVVTLRGIVVDSLVEATEDETMLGAVVVGLLVTGSDPQASKIMATRPSRGTRFNTPALSMSAARRAPRTDSRRERESKGPYIQTMFPTHATGM